MLRSRAPPKQQQRSLADLAKIEGVVEENTTIQEDTTLPTSAPPSVAQRCKRPEFSQDTSEEPPLDVRILLGLAALALLIGTGVGIYLGHHPAVHATLGYTPNYRRDSQGLRSFHERNKP